MAKFKVRERAISLRKQLKSYSQIKKILGVSKSSLSLWLQNYPLPKWRIRELRDNNEQRIEKFRLTMQAKKQARLDTVYIKQRKLLLPLTKRDLLIAGLFLYWGEGDKKKNYQIAVSNTDPSVILFIRYWLEKVFKVPRHRMYIRLHLYNDMNIRRETNFWRQILKLPLSQFRKPYIKEGNAARINYKGGYGHGTCNLIVGGVNLRERILMSIKCIQDSVKNKGA